MRLTALALSAALWSCNPVDAVYQAPDCPDTSWVMTKDTLIAKVHHRPCKTVWNPDVGDWVPTTTW